MADIINLKQYKKKKAKIEKEKKAENNRVIFGTPKEIKNKSKALNLIEQKRLENKKIEKENGGTEK